MKYPFLAAIVSEEFAINQEIVMHNAQQAVMQVLNAKIITHANVELDLQD